MESVSCLFLFSSRRRHTRFDCDWSSDVCSSDLEHVWFGAPGHRGRDPRDRTPVPRESYRRPRQDGHRNPAQYGHRDRGGRQRLRWCACAQVRRALRLGRLRIRADDAAEVSGGGRTRCAAAPRRGERGDALLFEPRVRVADAMSDAQQRYRRLGKYELHQLLGEGAMGIVWKAYDTVLRRYVALKLLSSSFRKTRDMQERFLREARAAGAIQHANIVTVYDLGESEGQLFIAMELVEGRDLSDIIALRDPLALERKLDIAIEVLAGLHFAHQRGVIHRDVKPSNVRVMPDGRVKIMDFGIARLQSGDATGSGAIVGTPTYMAPEQITNGAITAGTDVFAVGCMLYELLTFQRPFEAESVHGVLYQVLTTDPRPLRTVAPSIPAALERVVAKAMNKVPHERYESANQMMASLQGIRSALSGADDEATQPLGRWTPLPRPVLKLITHAPMKWRVAVLGALAVVVGLLLVSPGQPAAPQPGVFNPPEAAPPSALAAPIPIPTTEPVSLAVSSRRDSALAARDRSITAGALKNNVPAMILAEAMLRASGPAIQAGDQSRALRGYVQATLQYP